jgi:hypothetical protein
MTEVFLLIVPNRQQLVFQLAALSDEKLCIGQGCQMVYFQTKKSKFG